VAGLKETELSDSQREEEASLGLVVGRRPGKFRARCLQCGCHVIAQGGYRPGGQCTNCGSYELGPISQAETFASHTREVSKGSGQPVQRNADSQQAR
jgi:hypothetical protein